MNQELRSDILKLIIKHRDCEDVILLRNILDAPVIDNTPMPKENNFEAGKKYMGREVGTITTRE